MSTSASAERTTNAKPAPPPLLPRVAEGDEAAAVELTQRYRGLVWSLARRQMPTEAEAEDATQDIFLSVWQSAGRYDASVASEATFIATIARRRLIDRQRRRARRPEMGMIPEIVAGTNAPVDERGQVGEEANRAAQALEQLSENQQKVLRLSIYEGQSHEKIARTTGMPLGTVKTHARRGLIKLRELMTSPASNGDQY